MSILAEANRTVAPPQVRVSVVIPTFREAENLPTIVPHVADILKEHGLEGEIIVVDDDSADGTAEICAKLAEDYPVLLITRRTERGLSGAVLRGFAEATGDVLMVMDADMSHPRASKMWP